MLKWFSKTYGLGVVIFIPIAVFLLLASWFLSLISQININLVEQPALNLLIKFLIVVIGLPLLVGILTNIRWLRKFVVRFFSLIPNKNIQMLAKFFLNEEFIERISQEDLWNRPEVMFWKGGDSWTFRFLANKKLLPANPLDPKSPLVVWCIIGADIAPPLPTSVRLQQVPESRVVYTGRTAKDLALSIASFGTNISWDPKNFTVGGPRNKTQREVKNENE